MIAACSSVGLLAIANIVIVAYKSGRVTQKVDDLCRRMSRVEAAINGWVTGNPGNPGKKEEEE